MRLPVPSLRIVFGLFAPALLTLPLMAQDDPAPLSPREQLHQSEQWKAIEKRLPDPASATAQTLETQGDILRARRFPEDAIDYYKFALARGGHAAELLNKLGLVQLELRNQALARAYFQRVVKMDKSDADGWNNLGAVDYLNGRSVEAISDYKKAVKLKKRDAVFHSNLGTAYFEIKDYESARKEISAALKLDPAVFDHFNSGSGVTAHVLSSDDRARFSYEMAKLYARQGMVEQMLHSLAMASEAGMDVQREMRGDSVLWKFAADPRVVVLVHNAQALRASRASTASAAGAVPLSEVKSVSE